MNIDFDRVSKTRASVTGVLRGAWAPRPQARPGVQHLASGRANSETQRVPNGLGLRFGHRYGEGFHPLVPDAPRLAALQRPRRKRLGGPHTGPARDLTLRHGGSLTDPVGSAVEEDGPEVGGAPRVGGLNGR